MYVRYYTPAEIVEWEAAQNPAKLPKIDFARLANIMRWQAEQRR
jgi:hypothetical protein